MLGEERERNVGFMFELALDGWGRIRAGREVWDWKVG